jgi:hypothetical protein
MPTQDVVWGASGLSDPTDASGLSALAAAQVIASTSVAIAGGTKRVASNRSYARMPLRVEAAATRQIRPFTIEEQRLFRRAVGFRC